MVPAAWVAGERKVEHWRTLLRARAIENTVWVIGVGQPAPRYAGHSMVVAPNGDVVAEAGDDDAVLDAVLDRRAVTDVRRTNPSLAQPAHVSDVGILPACRRSRTCRAVAVPPSLRRRSTSPPAHVS